MAGIDANALRAPLEAFLRELLRAARFHLKFRIETVAPPDAAAPPGAADDPRHQQEPAGGPLLLVKFEGEDSDLLLQRGGELLDALEYVAGKALRLSAENQHLLSFDCRDFRMLHEAELRMMAEVAAERVERTGAPFALNPMDSRSRRIVHLALRDRPGVRTESEGAGPHRHIVIHKQK